MCCYLPLSATPILAAVEAWNPDPEISKYAKAGQVKMDRAPGRIGLMSTQRRASRQQRLYCTVRAETSGNPGDGSLSQGWKVSEFGSAFGARYRAVDGGRTAPMMSTLWSLFIWLATNFLLRDHQFPTFERLDRQCSSPPRIGLGDSTAAKLPTTQGSSILHIPNFPARTRIHHSLPHAPAGQRRWAERYDGKRNLYFKHAA
jgi:hypothetical protein